MRSGRPAEPTLLQAALPRPAALAPATAVVTGGIPNPFQPHYPDGSNILTPFEQVPASMPAVNCLPTPRSSGRVSGVTLLGRRHVLQAPAPRGAVGTVISALCDRSGHAAYAARSTLHRKPSVSALVRLDRHRRSLTVIGWKLQDVAFTQGTDVPRIVQPEMVLTGRGPIRVGGVW